MYQQKIRTETMRKHRLWIPIVLFLISAASYFGMLCLEGGNCRFLNYFVRSADFALFGPVLVISLSLIPAAIIVLFVSDTIYKWWRGVTAFWLFISGVILALTPTMSGGWLSLPARFMTALGLAGIYLAVSLLALTIVLSIRALRQKRK